MTIRRSTLHPGVRGLLMIVACYALIVGLFTLLESTILFPAPRLSRHALGVLAGKVGAQEVEVSAADGTRLYGWRVGRGDRLAIYFSGNGSTVGGPLETYSRLNLLGYEVLHINYRGYPGSAGRPSEVGLREDARAAWAEATRTHDPGRVLIVGNSLGGGVAVGLAAERSQAPEGQRPAGMMVMASFTSAVRVGQTAYPWLPVSAIMRNRFDSMALAPKIRCPALVLHGTRDSMIDIAHGRELAGAIDGARFVAIDGYDHNDPLLPHPDASAAMAAVFGPH